MLPEKIENPAENLLSLVTWIYPDRSLKPEIDRVAASGCEAPTSGHLVNALFLAPDSRELTFLTLDRRRREIAVELGFRT